MEDNMISKAERLKQVEEYRQSGKSLLAWCKEQGIAPSTLRHHVDREKKKRKAKFIEIKPTTQGIKLTWKNISLDLDPAFDEKTFQRILKVLGSLC